MQAARKPMNCRKTAILATSAIMLLISAVTMMSPSVQAQMSFPQPAESKVRLFAAGPQNDTPESVLTAGVQIKLEQGWHTYWRSPGDAGIPPSFDWSNSTNVKKVEILYPAPHRYKDPFGDSVVYENEVIFPVLVTPKDKSRPVTLNAKLGYGVCKDICKPGEKELSLTLSKKTKPELSDTARLSEHLNRVPEKMSANTAKAESAAKPMPKIKAVKAQLTGDNPSLKIDVHYPKGAENRDLFVEAEPGIYISMAKPSAEPEGNLQRYKVSLVDTDEPESLRGKTIILTATSSKGHSETSWIID